MEVPTGVHFRMRLHALTRHQGISIAGLWASLKNHPDLASRLYWHLNSATFNHPTSLATLGYRQKEVMEAIRIAEQEIDRSLAGILVITKEVQSWTQGVDDEHTEEPHVA